MLSSGGWRFDQLYLSHPLPPKHCGVPDNFFLYQVQSFGAGPLFQSVLFLSVWSSWQGWCSLFMTRGHRRLGISVSPSNRYLYCISAHTTFNFDQLDIINIVVIFNTWTIYKTDLSQADIWIWRRMMEAAPNWFPKGGKANQTDPALVCSTSLSSVQQSAHWSNQLSNQAPSHPIDPHHIHFSQVTDEKKFLKCCYISFTVFNRRTSKHLKGQFWTPCESQKSVCLSRFV